MSNGKGDKPRPYSVDLKTFGDNFDRIFGKKSRFEQEIDDQYEQYVNLKQSGMLWEFYPEMTGDWSTDKDLWFARQIANKDSGDMYESL